jgi:hypothetical protein
MTAWKGAGPTVVVGMGDDIAPDLLSRQMEDAGGSLMPKEQFDWDYLARPPAWVPIHGTLSKNLQQSLQAGQGTVGFDNQ